jgi:sulfide:quinone oxidoreductase
VDVTVLSKSDQFLFNPSLIWVPFGKRKARDLVFPLAKTFESHGVRFIHGEATQIDPKAQQVTSSNGQLEYDYLVIATGYLNDFSIIPGLGSDGNAFSITYLEGAVDAAEGWKRFLERPGPLVVGATQGAACFGAAYEFLFNAAYQLKKHKAKVPIHKGLHRRQGHLPDAEYPNVYAIGIAVAVNAPWTTANAVGVPKTGFPAETMARVAAENIASQVRGEPPTKEENFRDIPAVCVLDAGNNGVAILADKMLPPRKHGVMIPGPQSHAVKIAFEKYFMWKSKHGYVKLP